MQVRFTRAARRHRIGRASALHVMNTAEPTPILANNGDEALLFTGPDERGRELVIVAVPKPDRVTGEPILLVIHVHASDTYRK